MANDALYYHLPLWYIPGSDANYAYWALRLHRLFRPPRTFRFVVASLGHAINSGSQRVRDYFLTVCVLYSPSYLNILAEVYKTPGLI